MLQKIVDAGSVNYHFSTLQSGEYAVKHSCDTATSSPNTIYQWQQDTGPIPSSRTLQEN